MFGELTPAAIESLRHSGLVARNAYADRRGPPYIVPITYAYDGRAFYDGQAELEAVERISDRLRTVAALRAHR